MQKTRIHSRKFKNTIKAIFNNIKFKIESFSFPKIIILVGIIIGYISLFLKYISPIYSNIFNKITFVSGIIFFFFLTIISFLLFSHNKKEIIKKSTNIIFRDYIIILILSIILFIISINNLGVIIGLQTFKNNITYGPGIITSLISSIFIFSGAILLKNEYEFSKNIYLNDSPEEKIRKVEEQNTKLPF